MASGAMLGLLMASIFITAGELMLFFAYKNRTPGMEPFFEKYPPTTLALTIDALSYPTWAAIGALISILYIISLEQVPGGGIGSPNFIFTLAIIVVALMMAAPFMILLRKTIVGVLAITITFVGLFGWFLPYFVV